MEVPPPKEFDEDEMESFFKQLAESLETDTASPVDRIPKEKILKALNDLNILFSLHPADADHPEKRSAACEAAQVLSALDRSYGLADGQIERVGQLVDKDNWGAIIDRAGAANKAKQEASERLSRQDSVASSLRELMKSDRDLKEEYSKLEVESQELQRQIQELMDHSETVKSKKDEVRKERGKTLAEAKQLRDEYNQLQTETPKLKGKLDEATQSFDKAQREWLALKNLLDEVSAIFE